MSVLQRKELEDSPLADIHAIASELGIEGYRALRREDLIAAILGGKGDGDGAAGEQPDSEPEERPAAKPKRARRRAKVKDGDGDKPKSAESKKAEPKSAEAESKTEEPAEPEVADEDREVATGVLDVQANGSGFLRRADGPDVYVSPAQIRRCELRAGDEVSGPVRPPRRNERHPSLIRVDQVNGRDAEPLDDRARFEALTPVHPTERLAAPAGLDGVPFGKGSRVAIAGPSGAGATRLLRDIAATLAKDAGDLSVSIVLAGARPEEVTEWRREATAPVTGGSFDQSPEDQDRAALLAVESAKRVAERGGDAVVLIDGLQAFEAKLAKRLFGAGRKLDEGGSLTVVAVVGEDAEQLRLASTRIVLEAGAADVTVSADHSGTQRADLLA